MPLSYGLVPHLSKKLSKFPFQRELAQLRNDGRYDPRRIKKMYSVIYRRKSRSRCTGYLSWKWTPWPKFTSWTELCTFFIALIFMGKCCISLWPNKRHNNRQAHSLLEKYASDFIRKSCVWEGFGNRTELPHIDLPTLMTISVSFPFSRVVQLDARGASSLLGAGFLHHILFPKLSDLQTDWISCALSYIIVHAHSISPHNWPSEYVTSAVFGMARLIVIKQK